MTQTAALAPAAAPTPARQPDPLASYLVTQSSINGEVLQMEARRHWEEALRQPRYQQEKRLTRFGHKVYAQNDEDGIIAEILRRLGPGIPQTFIEFGVESGIECNTLALLMAGWKGLWLEGSEKYVAQIGQHLSPFIREGKLKAAQAFVTRDNVNELFSTCGMTGEIGLLSIDVDGNDIWIWKAVSVVNPAIVVIEYNSTWAPPLTIAQVDDPNVYWQGTNYFGASLGALEKIGRDKGYNLVGCNFSGANAFFVRADLCGDKFHAPYTAQEHYEPPRYWLRHIKAGHRAGVGPVVTL